MKKAIIVTVIIILAISFSIVGFEIFEFSRIPKEYRNQSISFINKDINWSENINKIKSRLGEYSVTSNSFNNEKTYHFKSSYDSYKIEILLATPSSLSKYISDVTYVFYVNDDTRREAYNKLKAELKNECIKNNITIETDNDNDWMFEASKSSSTYGITYTLLEENANIILNISLQY
ncbi:MAG: hypothetical protein IJJ41_04615 [Clostridia bacterium]|nr:hypothetical protein [Clostridia bacterium]